MNQRPTALLVVMGGLLLLRVAALAQFPEPTYGWNLGNTLEPPGGEGAWAPPATQQLINSVAAAGFNTIRIPVAWDSHANQTTYQIDPAWLARVKQVVDWCYAANLTVVVNCHWDGGWLDSKLDGNIDADVNAKMQSYWTQIANTFVNYDAKLLFAGANEPPADTAGKMSELMTYYQTFVDAVRATGGQNTNRWLVLSGPSTNIDLTYSLMNTLPNDPTPGRFVIEVHEYSPYQFTIMPEDASWGKLFYFWGTGYHHSTRLDRNATWGEEDYIISQYEKMRAKFTSKGIPVLLGEFGSSRRIEYPDLTGADYDLHLASRTYWNKVIVELANARGLRPVYWDAGWAGKNGGAIFDRLTASIIDQAGVTSLTGGPASPPPGFTLTIPTAPSSLSVAAASSAWIRLTWTDNSSNEGYLEIQRATDSSFTDGLVTTHVAAGTTTYLATALTPSTTYHFRVRATNGAGSSAQSNTFETATLPLTLTPSAYLAAIAARAEVSGGENVLIAGFAVEGTGKKSFLARAVGPALAAYGVAQPLAAPVLRVFSHTGQEIASNTGWSTAPDAVQLPGLASQVGAFELFSGSADSALILELDPGLYTLHASATGNASGVALAELYALDAQSSPFALSSRAQVRHGENILIGGVAIAGSSPQRLLLRAVGPALAAQGVEQPLADPVLEVVRNGAMIYTNDDWETGNDPAVISAAIAATGTVPFVAGSKDAAIVVDLSPGPYTVLVRGKGSAEGVALVEIYTLR